MPAMKKSTQKKWIGAVSIILFSSCLFGQSINFQSGSFAETQLLAKNEQKPLFVDVYTTWCQPCKWMEKEVFSDPIVAAYFNENFISFRVNAEVQEPTLIKELAIEAYPTMVFYTPSGMKSIQKIGAMNADEFLDLATGLVNIQSYYEAYSKKPENAENIHNFTIALNWQNPKKAAQIARKYLLELDEKKYADSLNWRLLKTFASPSDPVLYPRILSNNTLFEEYPKESLQYLNTSLEELLQESIDRPSTLLLKKYIQYVSYCAPKLSNADSLKLMGNLRYTQKHDLEAFVPLLIQYVETYEGKSAASKAEIARSIAENYFKNELLEFAIKLADQSLSMVPSSQAYIAKAAAYNKLNKPKQAYAYLLLAYEFADEDMKLALDKYGEELKAKMEYNLREGVNTIVDTQGTDDGRFTLGSGTKRLMYGYPVPKSTSHFVVNVNGKLASNAAHFSPEVVTRLQGETMYSGAGNTPVVTITFRFEGVRITQSLVPVDKAGKEILGGLAQYYKVNYSFENEDNQFKLIGLNILFDTMIDDNDFCTIAADGRLLKNEAMVAGKHIPSSLLFYRTPLDTSDHMGAAIIKGLEATPPDRMIVGNWPMFYHLTWTLKTSNIPYGDSAFLLQWENRRLGPKGKMQLTTYYGLPRHKKPTLRILLEDNSQLTMTSSIYFQHQSSELDLNAKMKIGDLLSDQTIQITGVLLNGYADITGSSDFNFALSQRRIENVGAIFKAYGIHYVPKPYGVDQAERNDYNALYGNVWDRRVEMIIYYRKKTTNVMEQLTGL